MEGAGGKPSDAGVPPTLARGITGSVEAARLPDHAISFEDQPIPNHRAVRLRHSRVAARAASAPPSRTISEPWTMDAPYARTSPLSAKHGTALLASIFPIACSGKRPKRCDPARTRSGAFSPSTASRWTRSVTMRSITSKGEFDVDAPPLHRPRSEAGHVAALANDDRAVLMKRERPIPLRPLVEERRADGKHRATAETGRDAAQSSFGSGQVRDHRQLAGEPSAGLARVGRSQRFLNPAEFALAERAGNALGPRPGRSAAPPRPTASASAPAPA